MATVIGWIKAAKLLKLPYSNDLIVSEVCEKFWNSKPLGNQSHNIHFSFLFKDSKQIGAALKMNLVRKIVGVAPVSINFILKDRAKTQILISGGHNLYTSRSRNKQVLS